MMTQNIATKAQRYTTLFSTQAVFLFYTVFKNYLKSPRHTDGRRPEYVQKNVVRVISFQRVFKICLEIILSRKAENKRDIRICRDENKRSCADWRN